MTNEIPQRSTRAPRGSALLMVTVLLAVLAVIGVLNSAVSLFYYARIIKAMYLEDALDTRTLPVPAVYTGVLVALAVPILALGVYWAPLVRWAAAAFGGATL